MMVVQSSGPGGAIVVVAGPFRPVFMVLVSLV